MTAKRDLQKQGFKPVPGFEALYINRTGQVYDYCRARLLPSRPKNRVAYNGRLLSVPKLLLSAYDKQPYNNRRQIRYIDGNKTNIAMANMCYTPDRSTLRINYADLLTAVRCYFEVPKRYKAPDRLRTKLYLSDIVHRRGFLYDYGDRKGIEIFRKYLDNPLMSLKSIADQNGIPVWSCTEIVNPLLNELIRDIMEDYRAGRLQIRNFQPRRKTPAQIIKEYNEHLKSYGVEPIKIPRKKSNAQILKEWDEYSTRLKNKCENPGDSL